MLPEDLEALPSSFAEDVLGLSLYDWQAEVLDSLFGLKTATALRTCNGAGKTTRVIAVLALWHCAVFPRSTTYITSGSWQQIKNQLMPALKAHVAKLPGWTFNETHITSPTGSFISVFSSNDPGKVEGKHEEAENPVLGPCLIIVDEAKTVSADNFQAIDRCSWTRLLYASSPGGMHGNFYDAFHRDSGLFKCFKASREDCPKADQARFERIIKKWGINHPFTRSTVFAEFMTDDGMAQYAISMNDVQRCLLNPPTYLPYGRIIYWCDFAAGGDENVLGKREGNRINILRAWREKDTFKAAAEFVTMLRSDGAKPSQVYGDGSGMGINFFNDMAAMGFDVPGNQRIKNNSVPNDSSTYADKASELWYEGGLGIRDGKFILPERDDELVIQLATRKVKDHKKGLLDLESKQDMKSRGLSSPDRGETVTSLIALDTAIEYTDDRYGDSNRLSSQQSQRNEKFEELSW